MQPGDTFAYTGDATRPDDEAPLEIEGSFRAVEQRTVNGEQRWLVEDARLGTDDLPGEAAPHRYLLPAGFAGPQTAG